MLRIIHEHDGCEMSMEVAEEWGLTVVGETAGWGVAVWGRRRDFRGERMLCAKKRVIRDLL